MHVCKIYAAIALTSILIACPPTRAQPASLLSGLAEGQAMVMFNPRLASGDVGVGLSVSAWNTFAAGAKRAGCPL